MSKYQSYVSSELTHFVGRSLTSDQERYELLVNIVKTGIIRTRNNNSRGGMTTRCSYNADISKNEAFNPDMVCFCDIPITDFDIHMKKYSHFGISFSKKFMISQGLRPVFYIPKNSIVVKEQVSDIFNKNLKKFKEFISDDPKIDFQFEQFFSFQIFSFIKFFDDKLDEDDPDNFYMEREWRGLKRIEFKLPDITRIILPSSYKNAFLKDIPEYNAHVTTILKPEEKK